MSEHVVTVGLRTIGAVVDRGRQWEAWAEPGREALGLFNTYEAACRAIFARDLEQRAGGGQ